MARIVNSGRLVNAHVSVPADFYRQEFIKHRECLARQREYFSEGAITTADQALARVLNQLEQLCACDNADQVIAGLLRKFNAVTNLSAWSDPQQLH
ncbi:MAG: hypothetical protein ACRD15_16825 [Vicinamibacterales bacterium]